MKIEISEEDHNFLVELKRRLKTQNNRKTQDPYYCVQEKVFEITSDGYEDDEVWFNHSDGVAATHKQSETLDRWDERKYADGNLGDWQKHLIKWKWKTVATTISEQDALDIKSRIRTRNDKRVYAMSAYGIPEIINLRRFVMNYSENNLS